MDQRDAIAFFSGSLIRKDLLRASDIPPTAELVDELSCLPLAIKLAAAYLDANTMSIDEYLRLFRHTSLTSKEFRDDTQLQHFASAVVTSWLISFRQIRERDLAAADLLTFISLIECQDIPRSLLPYSHSAGLPEEAIDTLCQYRFLERQKCHDQERQWLEEEYYDMYSLAHVTSWAWASRTSEVKELAENAVRHMVEIWPSVDQIERAKWRAYLPHAIQLLENLNLHECKVEEQSELCILVGDCLREEGRLKEAVRWLGEGCRLRNNLEERDPDRLLAQHLFGMALYADGQVQRAIALLEHVVALRERESREDDSLRLWAQHELAEAYGENGQTRQAVVLLEHVVAVREKVLERTPPTS